MRIGPEDPVFARLPLYLIRKYFFDNRIFRFFLYAEGGKVVCAAPEEVLLRDRQRLERRSLFLRTMDIRARTLTLQCSVNGEDQEMPGLLFAELLQEGERHVAVAQEDPALLKLFPHPAGLFNYHKEHGRLTVNFHPDFGHGEHVEYFIASAGTPYGLFSPASFIQVEGIDRHRSRQIFEELIRARILSKSGRLIDPERLKEFDFMTALTDAQERSVMGMLLYPEKMSSAVKRFAGLPAAEMGTIARDLSVSGLELKPDHLAEHLRWLSEEDRKNLFEFFCGRIVSHLIGDEIIRSRGIVMENRKKEALVLLYEPWEVSSAWLGDMMDFMRSRKPTFNFFAALAYTRAPARRRENLLHPLVEALRDLERKKYLESAREMVEGFYDESPESLGEIPPPDPKGLPDDMSDQGRF